CSCTTGSKPAKINAYRLIGQRPVLGPWEILPLNRNQVNAIYRSSTRSNTFSRGINKGIDLGDIKSGISGIHFTIRFHHRRCRDTVLVYLNGRPDTFDVRVLNRHGSTPYSPREAYLSFRQSALTVGFSLRLSVTTATCQRFAEGPGHFEILCALGT